MSTESSSPLYGPSQQPPASSPPGVPDDEAQAAVIRRTVEVIGNRSDAMRWLGMPVRALNYATPISLLHDPKGRKDVLTVLGRLEHGVL